MPELSALSLGSDASLEGYWKFESGVTDSSGNSNNLTANNSPTYVSGLFGSCIDFESGSSQNASIADNASLSITGDLSISVWLQWESLTGGEMTILGKYQAAPNSDYLFLWNDTGDNFQFYVSADGTSVTSANVSFTPTTGIWYHVALTYDASAGTADVYVNGVVKGSMSSLATSIHDGSGVFRIGAYNSTAQSFWDGKMDDAAIFSRLLTSMEISSIYASGRGNPMFFSTGGVTLG